MPRGEVSGYGYEVHTLGQGPRQIMALHCGLARGMSYTGIAEVLGEGVTLTAPDLPGHGQSDPWVGQGDYSAIAVAIAEAAAPEGTFDLIGHSWGAVLSLAYAVRHPERVRSVTLFEPVLFALAKADGRPEGAQNDRDFEPAYLALEADDPVEATRVFTSKWGGSVTWEAIPERSRAYMVERMHTILAGGPLLHEDAGGILAPGALGQITAPVLLIEGARSPAVAGAILDGLEARLPQSKRVVIPEAAHMAPITRAGEVGGHIRDFLRGIPVD